MNRRGLSPVVGFILLVGITAIAAMSLFVVGLSLADATKSAAEEQQLERSMSQFAATADELATGESNDRTFSIQGSQGDHVSLDEEAGHVRVVLEYNGTQEIIDEDLGAMVYERPDGTQVAYQGGGVWRDDEGGATMVRAPEFHYRADRSEEATLTFPLVRMQGSLSENARMSGSLAVEDQNQLYPTGNDSNPLEGGEVYVEIESQYCRAWENHLEDRTDAGVQERCSGSGPYTDDGELRFQLVVPPTGWGLVEHGVVAPNLEIGNAGGTEVDGDVLVNDSDDVDESSVTGAVEEGDTAFPAIEEDVEDMVDDCGSFQDVSTISSPGRHCVSVSAVENGLTVQPDSGQVEIVVPGSVKLSGGGSSLDVQDGDLVEIYVDGSFSTKSQQPHVGNPNDPSQTHLYVTGDVTVNGIASDHFNAVIYAPHGTFEMSSRNSEVHGAVLANEVDIGGGARIVYDDRVAGRTLDVEDEETDVTTIYYLHVSETVMSVDES